MWAHIVAAGGEIYLGLLVYKVLDPEKAKKTSRFLRWDQILEFENRLFDSVKNLVVIRRANLIALFFCFFSALIILVNGVFHVYFNMIDFKEVILIVTVIGIWPLRYGYIFLRKV